jgi:predicted nucleotidyltransferase
MKNTDTKERILDKIFEFPTREYHLRELSRLIKISPNSISNALKELEKENLILIEKNITLKIKANPNNDQFKYKKRINNLNKIYSSGLIEYINEKFPLSTTILFGSYSKGEDNEKSDIDIAILDTKEKALELEKYEQLLNRKMNIECINLKNLTKELKNSIINGITLKGQIEL